MTAPDLSELDLAAARAEGHNVREDNLDVFGHVVFVQRKGHPRNDWFHYHPSTDPAEAMRLLEKYKTGGCQIGYDPDKREWYCHLWENPYHGCVEGVGETLCVAICRCVCAMHVLSHQRQP